MRVSHSEIHNVIDKHVKCNIPLYISGQPGVGKSDRVRQYTESYAKELGKQFVDWNAQSTAKKKLALVMADDKLDKALLFVDIRLSQKESSDLNGIPMKVEQNGLTHMEWLPPLLISVLSRPTCHAIVFFDELPNAPLIVQNAAYQFIHDRAVGEVTLSKHVRILAAGNRVIDRSNVYDRSLALKNRFSNIELDMPTAKEWGLWARSQKDEKEDQLIDPRLIAFVMANETHLSEDITKVSSDSFRTPRTVAKAGVLTRDESSEATDALELYAGVQAGLQFGSAFARYVEASTAIDIDQVISNPEGFNRLNVGQKWFVIEAMPNWFFSLNKKPYNELVDFLDKIDAEMAIALIINCKGHKNGKQFINSITLNERVDKIERLWKFTS